MITYIAQYTILSGYRQSAMKPDLNLLMRIVKTPLD